MNVSDRTGCGLIELTVLETMSAAAAASPRPHVVCTKVVASVEERLGLGPRYGYDRRLPDRDWPHLPVQHDQELTAAAHFVIGSVRRSR
jgi:hypothetical protein